MNYQAVQQAADFIRSRTKQSPVLAVILGSGLGALADRMTDCDCIPYSEIPGFPHSSVQGHADRLVIGSIGETVIAAMQGRFHYYEGFTMQEITFPIFVLKALGVKDLIVTNACGGINEQFTPGDLMLITDHINLLGKNPLIGPNDERFGPRFPDMTEVYDRGLIRHAQDTAADCALTLQEGVYALFSGPCYETAAEIRAYRVLGADAIGMSTVPEAIAATHCGMRVLGITLVTNMAAGILDQALTHEEVQETAAVASARFTKLVDTVIERVF